MVSVLTTSIPPMLVLNYKTTPLLKSMLLGDMALRDLVLRIKLRTITIRGGEITQISGGVTKLKGNNSSNRSTSPNFSLDLRLRSPTASPSTEDMLKTLTQHFTTHVQTTESSIKNMEKQIGQLAQAVTHLAQRNSNSLPAQPEVNPQVRNVSAITLRSGKYLGESPLAEKDEIAEEEVAEPNTRPLTETRARASPSEESLTKHAAAQMKHAPAHYSQENSKNFDTERDRAPSRARALSPDQTGVSEPNTRPRPDLRARASADPRPRLTQAPAHSPQKCLFNLPSSLLRIQQSVYLLGIPELHSNNS